MATDNYLVSVLMCVYNEPSNLLRESIESILNQTYTNFEFIIICDNPTNVSVINIVEEYKVKDKRIVFSVNEKNIGLTRSLNVGLTLCRGKYVVRMDADDISLQSRIAKEVSYMEKNPDVNACSSYIKYINSEGEIIGERRTITKRKKLAVQGIFATPLIHPASIIRRIVNNSPICYDESLKYAQDFGLWSSLPIGSLSNIPDCLLLYRLTENQITSRNRSEQQECEKNVQYSNLLRQGIALDNNIKRTYDLLINGKEDSQITAEDIEDLIEAIINGYAGLVDKQSLYDYLAKRYTTCLIHRRYSLFSILLTLRKLSMYYNVGFVKPFFFVFFKKVTN